MTLLGKYTNGTLRRVLEHLEDKGDYDKIQEFFGNSPYYFELCSDSPVPKYHLFLPKYIDKEGREYTMLESGSVLGVRLRIKKNKNKYMELPTVDSEILLYEIGGGHAFRIRVISSNMSDSRISTGWIEYSTI